MNKKTLLFLIACFLICIIPSVGTLFFPTTESTENKTMAEAPELFTDSGALNKDFFNDFESYFNERMALRNQLVYADAQIQSGVFRQSNVSGVICGADDWLYYSSTLDDYLGTDVMSDRELYNLAHNFSVVQEYLESKDIAFALTVPPNKNTLYGENMPYYDSRIVNSSHSAKLLSPMLSEKEINYVNLFELFEAQDEVLYLRKDSHWNMKGACMAYNGIMDALKVEHESYASVEPVAVDNEDGDLNRMLYSFYGKPETDYSYELGQKYSYSNDAQSVEDGWIITGNKSGKGGLLMFRDSFANTLIPFMSNEFETAYYSKGMPNAMERFVDEYSPECVVIEKVERNIGEYLSDPPILTPVETEKPERSTPSPTDTNAVIEVCESDINYYKISGEVDKNKIENTTEILVAVGDSVYRAYQTGENGYVLYLNKSLLDDTSVKLRIYAVNNDRCIQVLAAKYDLPQ